MQSAERLASARSTDKKYTLDTSLEDVLEILPALRDGDVTVSSVSHSFLLLFVNDA
jgi:hypothetical protein